MKVQTILRCQTLSKNGVSPSSNLRFWCHTCFIPEVEPKLGGTQWFPVQNLNLFDPLWTELGGKNSSPRLTAMAKKVTPNCRDCEGPPVFSSASGSSPLRSSAKCCVNKGSSRAAAQKTAQLYQNLEGFCNFFRSGSLWIYSKFWIHQVCNVGFRVPKPEPPKETWLRDCLTNGRPKTQTT